MEVRAGCLTFIVFGMSCSYYYSVSLSHSAVGWSVMCHLGDNCIQNFYLGRYIVGYTVGNLVLRRCVNGAVKRDFRTYIRRYTSRNENFEYGYPHSNALLTFPFKKTVKMYFVAPIRAAAASCIKPLASCI